MNSNRSPPLLYRRMWLSRGCRCLIKNMRDCSDGAVRGQLALHLRLLNWMEQWLNCLSCSCSCSCCRIIQRGGRRRHQHQTSTTSRLRIVVNKVATTIPAGRNMYCMTQRSSSQPPFRSVVTVDVIKMPMIIVPPTLHLVFYLRFQLCKSPVRWWSWPGQASKSLPVAHCLLMILERVENQPNNQTRLQPITTVTADW